MFNMVKDMCQANLCQYLFFDEEGCARCDYDRAPNAKPPYIFQLDSDLCPAILDEKDYEAMYEAQ